MVRIPGYSSHAGFNLEVDFSWLRETDCWACWTLQLVIIAVMKWAAALLHGLGKSPKLAQEPGWKLSLRWGLKSRCGISKELLFGCGIAKLPLLQLVPGTQENPLHPTECSWLGRSLDDQHILIFPFLISEWLERREEQGERRGPQSFCPYDLLQE